MKSEEYLKTVELCRYYTGARHVVRALEKVSVEVRRGEFVGIVGASGSGKTTLMNLLAGLDTPTSGVVEIGGASLGSMTRRELASYRAWKVGMVFQSFNLIAHYSALQNVETALYFTGTPPAERRRLAGAMLERMGLGDRLDHRPADLSGGEQQRVAVARAIVKKPEILFADEPTGNLDFENARQLVAILRELNREGLTLVMVTHNLELAEEQADRVIRMQYGQIVHASLGAAPGRERA